MKNIRGRATVSEDMQNKILILLAAVALLGCDDSEHAEAEFLPSTNVEYRLQDACGYGECMVEFGDRACCTAPCSEWDVPGCAELCLDTDNNAVDCLSTNAKIVVATVFGESVTYKCEPRSSYCVDTQTECVSFYGFSPQQVACDSCDDPNSACYIKNATPECSCIDIAANAPTDCANCDTTPCRFD